ncbi:hypothetical protein [Streptomyces lydicamycinicus]|uniref:hypothetical protein n=1 Tax=Streptomyces lydicamycinicus TaxID=1546107 RepID=UPI001CA4FD0A
MARRFGQWSRDRAWAGSTVSSSQRLGRHRWAVERTVSRLAGGRRLHRRHEREADHFLAFVGIATAHEPPSPHQIKRQSLAAP